MTVSVFGVELEKTDEAVNAARRMMLNTAKPERAFTFFKTMQLKTWISKDKVFVVGRFEPSIPRLYYVAFYLLALEIALWYLLSYTTPWFLVLEVLYLLTIVLWTPDFYAFMFKAGMRKAGCKQKMDSFFRDKLAGKLLEVLHG